MRSLEEYLRMLVDLYWIKPLENCTDPVACLQDLITRNIAGLPDDEVFYGCLLNNLANETSGTDEELRAHIDRDLPDLGTGICRRPAQWPEERDGLET